jgi:hypothetical protein
MKMIKVIKVLIFFSILQNNAFAFKPTAEFGHVGIVRDAIKGSPDSPNPIERTTSNGNTIKFSDRAIKEIRDSDAEVDHSIDFLNASAHCDNEQLETCSDRILQIKNFIIANLKSDQSRNGPLARYNLGRLLHTLQDFYSHSNWVESTNGSEPNLSLGNSIINSVSATTTTCEADGASLITTGLTSGYFPFNETNKCAHGFEGTIGNVTILLEGIHKDDPSRNKHGEAREAAVKATRNIIEEILDAEGIKGNDVAIAEFMDAYGTLGFVVDDTGSMGTEISQVQNIVTNVLQLAQSDPDISPTNYLFERFGDPDVGEPLISKSVSEILNAAFSLSPNGGGDCPELSQTALLKAIDAAEVRGQLHLISDASAKDSELKHKVAAAAQDKDIKINYEITGSCSPIDPAYIEVAQATGGQVFFIAPTEVDKLFNLIKPSLYGDLEPMLLVRGVHDGAVKEYTIPVDSSITGLTISVTSDSLTTASIYRPTGAEVTASDSDTSITSLATAKIISLTKPVTGEWKLAVSGSGVFSVSISGNSTISLNDFDFVEETGRPGHTGLFSINGQPVKNKTPITAKAFITGAIDTATFDLRTEEGTLIKTIALDRGTGEVAIDEFVGNFDLPNERFRVYVSGKDALGNAYMRVFPNVYKAQSVSISPELASAELTANNTTTVKLTITNFGTADQFTISATNSLGLPLSINPTNVSLGENESKIIEVTLTAPDVQALSQLSGGILIVEATSQSNSGINNTAVVDLIIGKSNNLTVNIDVKPGNSSNTINLSSDGVVTVAILNTQIAKGETIDFDPALIDRSTLNLSGSVARQKGNSGHIGNLVDIDGDGDQDLIVQFETSALELSEANTLAVLQGVLLDGTKITGEDFVSVVP